MANYESVCRTNYFRVKDAEKFERWASELGGPSMDCSKNHGLYCLYDGDDCGSMPTYRIGDDDQDEEIEIDFMTELSQHLQEGEVAVYMESGHEKHRYVCGYAIAVNAAGETRSVSLGDIYELAKQLGPNCTEASY